MCVYVCVGVCVRERIKMRKKENRDRRSANGTSSPFSIKILVLQNQCLYSVDYGFVELSYTHCQLVKCAYVCACERASVASHFANSLLCHMTLCSNSAPCSRQQRATQVPARPGGLIWWVNLQQRCSQPLNSLRKGASSSFVQHRKLLVLHPTGASVEFDEFLWLLIFKTPLLNLILLILNLLNIRKQGRSKKSKHLIKRINKS